MNYFNFLFFILLAITNIVQGQVKTEIYSEKVQTVSREELSQSKGGSYLMKFSGDILKIES